MNTQKMIVLTVEFTKSSIPLPRQPQKENGVDAIVVCLVVLDANPAQK